ncbi:hypothetical protein [Paenibacillus donghaensis]|uniref:Restriction endonuclease type IV Mrr domain-containing protein n=1 Tax=Paenibacillus donghaensis TaxID=414771 RepID=A0A2Z2KJB0_9BACL|nr:hypothetical protein [Paenibacillus donghaensis]ASA23370.1 hypothetical protein B9T62_22720 [Paenibacillus donghaensis]
MQTNIEMKKLAIEIIATLVNIKNQMYEYILKPAGINKQYFADLLKRRNPDGKQLTKREMGAIILDALEEKPENQKSIRKIISIGAHWSQFHLAGNEMQARATVQKAREVLNLIEIMEEKEVRILNEEREKEKRLLNEKKQKAKIEKELEIKKGSELLLLMYDDLVVMKENPQKRGFMLEELMNMLFNVYDIALMESFRRNDGGEQIDGAFKIDGWHYIVEIKWTTQLTDIRQLDSLYGKVARSGKQTMGLFVSISGWSNHVIPLMKQHPDKSVFLMDGYDLRKVLSQEISLIDLLQNKIAKFNIESEPFVSVSLLI